MCAILSLDLISSCLIFSFCFSISNGNYPNTFSITIRNANPIMRGIHNGGDNPYRMPLVVPPPIERSWLDPNLSDAEMKLIFDYEITSEELEYYSVKRDRKSVV